MKLRIRIHAGELISPIESLEQYFQEGGASVIQAAFAHTYFVHPDEVLRKNTYFPEFARKSREHYPGLDKGAQTTWGGGDGRRTVTLDDNSRAQLAWERYTGHKLARRSGYSVRHIWGNTHNPDVYTAGWNLCYMPFWAGMLTEDQHPHHELQRTIRQASWDLFFSREPDLAPGFVENPGLDLSTALSGRPLLILHREASSSSAPSDRRVKRGSPLPITLHPPKPRVFLDNLLKTKQAWIEVSYQDGRKVVRPWNAAAMRPSSNVIGNLRSRPEFRAGAWRKHGIASVRVSIEHPRSRAG